MALRYYADLRAPVSKQMLMLLSAHASEAAEAERLRFLASPDGKADYSSYVQVAPSGVTPELVPRRCMRACAFAHLATTHTLPPRTLCHHAHLATMHVLQSHEHIIARAWLHMHG